MSTPTIILLIVALSAVIMIIASLLISSLEMIAIAKIEAKRDIIKKHGYPPESCDVFGNPNEHLYEN